tara:strand:+ start:11976 stop:12773 length:798 start_codon:yes stop_codon:yes gene_type:complete
MKKYLVIGNPIDHSLSPLLHNYWIKKYKIDATYEKKLVRENDLKSLCNEVREGKLQGFNITVPFKKSVIPFLNELTSIAKETESVNTIFQKNNKTIGDNTDVNGFKMALESVRHKIKGKKVFILGAGGVVPSIILALKKMNFSDITLSNRTIEKAEILKEKYSDLKIIKWGDIVSCDIFINATSIGLNKSDEIKLDYSKIGSNKLFYDVIYNPKKTKFLLKAEKSNNFGENGKMMFLYQAQLAFKIWHNVEPKIDKYVIKLIDND